MRRILLLPAAATRRHRSAALVGPNTTSSRRLLNSGSANTAAGASGEEQPVLTAAPLHHGVSHTALLTTALRAREQQEQIPLFYDPYAPLLGEEGLKLLDAIDADDAKAQAAGTWHKGARVSGLFVRPETIKQALHAMVPIRHKYFDDFLVDSMDKVRGGNHHKGGVSKEGLPLQFVNLACGLDSRAFRLPWPRNTRVYEVDRAEVLTYKAEKLGASGAKPMCAEHHLLHADVVADPWDKMLLERGFDPSVPSIWLVEGLLPYLPEAEVTRLLKRMRALASPGSFVAADHPGTRLKDSAVSKPVLQRLDRMRAPLISSTDDPEDLLISCGWDAPAVASLGDETAHYGRWPFRPTPRWVPTAIIPRFWLMTAMASKKFKPTGAPPAAAAAAAAAASQ